MIVNDVFIFGLTICLAAMLILFLISLWNIFQKAGQAGWKAIIPVYNYIVVLKMTYKPIWWIYFYIAMIAFSIINKTIMSKLTDYTTGVIFLLIYSAVMITSIVYSVKMCLALCKCFGRGVWFGIGFLFLPIIFLPILAFSDNVYTAPDIKE